MPVAIKNGNFYTGNADLVAPKAGQSKLQLYRVYNSKSGFVGMFGPGWGTEFETYLDLSPDQHTPAYLHEWGGGAISVAGPEISAEAGGWKRTAKDGHVEHFAADGRLTGSDLASGEAYRLTYDGPRLLRIASSKGPAIELRWDGNRVAEATLAPEKATYEYDSRGELVHAVDGGGEDFRYDYDAGGRFNLTQILYRDGSSTSVDYFGLDQNENVERLRERDGTDTRFAYQVAAPGKLHVEVINQATSQTPEKRSEFDYDVTPLPSPAPVKIDTSTGSFRPVTPATPVPMSALGPKQERFRPQWKAMASEREREVPPATPAQATQNAWMIIAGTLLILIAAGFALRKK